MSERADSEAGNQQADPELEYLQQLVGADGWIRVALQPFSPLLHHSQIKDNEFLQRENLLLEAYLSKIDFSKIGIDFDDDPGVKVRLHGATRMACCWCTYA